MKRIIIFILSAFLFFSPMFSGTENNEGIGDTEVLMQRDGFPICLSFEHYKMQDGWTPVVLSMGEINCLLWMDASGRVFEMKGPNTDISEPVCFIDVSTKILQERDQSIHFDAYEQNKIRSRWRLSSDRMKGNLAVKMPISKEIGIELDLGIVRLQLKYVACDFKEFSPGLYHVQFYGPSMMEQKPLIYEKASKMIYSTYEWDKQLTPKQNTFKSKSPVTPTTVGIPAQERAVLIALYNSTDGDNWKNNSGWKTPPLAPDGFALPGTENTWLGIGCDPGNTTVQSIYLAHNNLNGTLHPELGNLINLQSLHLELNLLSGNIPSELGKLADLQYLYLDSNQLSGNIPLELLNLTNLIGLSLSWNQFSGTIPAGLGNLTNLGAIMLGHNQLSGNIPSELGKLTNLQWLLLGWDQISGTIPPELGNLTNLKYLYIGSTQISGSIPSELGNLTNLQVLWLGWNQLCGSIPSELGNLVNLQNLWLCTNHLSGNIPPELGNLANLHFFWLYSNRLSGSFPSEFGNLANLNSLNFNWNALYTNDDILSAFLDSKQWGWENTQTIAPTNITATAVSTSSIEIKWTPIIYTSNSGGYRVFYSTTPGGPYTYIGITADKLASSLTVTGLNPGTTYYFVVQTRTYPHANNQNTVDSEFSSEVSAMAPPIILTSPNGGESWGFNTKRTITWTFSGLSSLSNIRLELWKANKKLGNIVASFPIVNGYYDWTVGYYGSGIASTGKDYKVKIITANGLYSDMSNATFSIIQPSLILTSPRSNTSWQQGTQQNITWTSVGLIGNVKLLLFKDGKQVGVIARGIPIANETYTWTVGKSSSGLASKGSNYTVKIRCEDNNFYSSGSGPFTIW